MEDEQSVGVEDRLAHIEGRLKTIQICLYILLGWVVVMSTPFGEAFRRNFGNTFLIIMASAAIALGFLWAVSSYQGKMGEERQESLNEPSGNEPD